MTFDFDKILHSDNSDHKGESRFDSKFLEKVYGGDVLSFWMAETDFPCPPGINEALDKMAGKASYLYQFKTDELRQSICNWFQNRHQLKLDPAYLLFTGSVMNGIAAAIEEFSANESGVIIQPPVYQEFKSTIVGVNRKVIKNSLLEQSGKYTIDFTDLEEKASDPTNSILLICSPHNPVGRVWTREELSKIIDICKNTQTLLLSDEIHSDIILSNNSFTGVMSMGENAISNSIMIGSPGKTFGIPGISDAFLYIPDETMRLKMNERIHRYHLLKSNAFTNVATIAGYTHDGPWLDAFLKYIENNVEYIHGFLKDHIPQITCSIPEGTYQVWLDFRKLGLDVHALRALLSQKAGIGLNAGYGYGREGAGFARMNIATQRIVLTEGLERLKKALDNFQYENPS